VTPQSKKSYFIINALFAGIFGFIFVYSGLFTSAEGGHSIPSACDLFNLSPCPSKGLSRSFSAIMQGDIHTARSLNPMGPRLFLFFVAQLFMRFVVLTILFRAKKNTDDLLWTDIGISIMLFLGCFYPFFEFSLSLYK
jgi:hypothetical protein